MLAGVAAVNRGVSQAVQRRLSCLKSSNSAIGSSVSAMRKCTMVDTRSTAKRSEIMSKVRSTNTAPELKVRQLIFGMGYRYRLHVAKLPGKPDIVMAGRRKIIDVRGCFWHGHENCRYGRLPKSRKEFWGAKIARNGSRDRANLRRLKSDGWRVLVLWQCQMKNVELLKKRLYEFIESK